MLVFDNGVARADENGELLAVEPHSRALELVIDEQTMRASMVFQYGGSTPGDPDFMFSPAYGDADLLPGRDALQFVVGSTQPMFIGEISYPGAERRWSYSCLNPQAIGWGTMYRVNYFPTLYDTAWQYDAPGSEIQ